MKEISESTTDEAPEGGPGWTEVLGGEATNPPTPRRSGDVILVMGPCESCDGSGADEEDPDGECAGCKGTGKGSEVLEEWTVSSCEHRVKAQMEQWVRRGAKVAIAEADTYDGIEEAAKLRSTYAGDFGAGHYNWDGKYVRSARNDFPGLIHLLFLLLKRCDPDVTKEDAERLFNNETRACGDAIRWAMGGNGSPPAKTGAKAEKKTKKAAGRSR